MIFNPHPHTPTEGIAYTPTERIPQRQRIKKKHNKFPGTHLQRKIALTHTVIAPSFQNYEDKYIQRQIFSFRKRSPVHIWSQGSQKDQELFPETDRMWVEVNRMMYLNT